MSPGNQQPEPKRRKASLNDDDSVSTKRRGKSRLNPKRRMKMKIAELSWKESNDLMEE